MKRLFILLVFCASFTFARAEKPDSLVTGTNVEKLIDKYSDKLSAGISSLAQILKQPVEHVYKVLVMQQVVYSMWILLTFITLVSIALYLLISGYRKWNREIEKANGDRYARINCDDGPWGAYIYIGWTFLIISLIVIFTTLDICITGFINPEYGAIKEIANFLK